MTKISQNNNNNNNNNNNDKVKHFWENNTISKTFISLIHIKKLNGIIKRSFNTWHGRRREEMIWKRLDRGATNYEWLSRFPTGRVTHLNCFTSNHRQILLSLDGNGE